VPESIIQVYIHVHTYIYIYIYIHVDINAESGCMIECNNFIITSLSCCSIASGSNSGENPFIICTPLVCFLDVLDDASSSEGGNV
jgi:hypothetical protein